MSKITFLPPTHSTDSSFWAETMGSNARIDNRPTEHNPYDVGTANRQIWAAAWRREDERKARESARQAEQLRTQASHKGGYAITAAPTGKRVDLRIFWAIAIGAALLSYLWWGIAAHASPLGEGNPLPKCMTIEQKADAMKLAAEKGTVQTFDADTSQTLINAINGLPPATDFTATIVDVITIADAPFPVRVFFTDDKLVCMVAVFKKAEWDTLADKVFGRGV